MYLLGTVYRQQGRNQEALELLTKLYNVVLETQTNRSDNAAGLAKTLCELYNEASAGMFGTKYEWMI